MGTQEVFVDLQPSGDDRHVLRYNGALQDVQGQSIVALLGEVGKQVLIPDVLYVPSVHANLLSAGQLKENGVKLKQDGDGILLDTGGGDVLGRASYTGRVLCTDLRPYSTKSTTSTTDVVALRAIASATNSTPYRLHARLAHVGMDTIRSSAKDEVANGLNLMSASAPTHRVFHASAGSCRGTSSPTRAPTPTTYWPSCLSTFAERQTKKSVLMLRSDQGGEFLGKEFTAFVDDKGIIHDLTCPYTPQQNGMAEREMRAVVELVRMMLLHMGVQHHWWHLILRQAVWVRNCLERLTLPPRTTPYQLLTRKKPDLSLAHVWNCMAQFLVPDQQRGRKLKPKAWSGLHIGMSEENKGCELLDIVDNREVTTSNVVFYETMSLEVWKSEHAAGAPRRRPGPTPPVRRPSRPHAARAPPVPAPRRPCAARPGPAPLPRPVDARAPPVPAPRRTCAARPGPTPLSRPVAARAPLVPAPRSCPGPPPPVRRPSRPRVVVQACSRPCGAGPGPMPPVPALRRPCAACPGPSPPFAASRAAPPHGSAALPAAPTPYLRPRHLALRPVTCCIAEPPTNRAALQPDS
ncbi:unnamed protein product [Closterium sp. NIES-65]|nr:unnamed protein product [Closterium sp. NIES-65]